MLISSYYSWQFIWIIFELENGVMTTPKRRSISPALIFTCFKFGIELNISVVVGMIIRFLTTCFSYFNVFRIICRHQRQVQANVSSQSFAQPAINLAK